MYKFTLRKKGMVFAVWDCDDTALTEVEGSFDHDDATQCYSYTFYKNRRIFINITEKTPKLLKFIASYYRLLLK